MDSFKALFKKIQKNSKFFQVLDLEKSQQFEKL